MINDGHGEVGFLHWDGNLRIAGGSVRFLELREGLERLYYKNIPLFILRRDMQRNITQ